MPIKKISDLLSSTNIIVALSLVVILWLVYLKNNNFELFTSTAAATTTTKPKGTGVSASATTSTKSMTIPITTTTLPATTIPLLNNDIIKNSALVNFINRFIVNKNQQNVYVSALSEKQRKINNLSEQVLTLINPSS